MLYKLIDHDYQKNDSNKTDSQESNEHPKDLFHFVVVFHGFYLLFRTKPDEMVTFLCSLILLGLGLPVNTLIDFWNMSLRAALMTASAPILFAAFSFQFDDIVFLLKTAIIVRENDNGCSMSNGLSYQFGCFD